MEQEVILSLRNITKTFPGVKALDDISVDFFKGEVHSIAGENGAGKSTLMKILTGVYSLEQGEIWLNGIKEKIRNPLDAIKKGLSIIFQEFNLIDALSITENIFIDRLSKSKGMWIDWKEANRKAAEFMKEVGYDIDTTPLIKDLSVAEKQMVEIAKAISYGSKIIIMDEPSATLTSREVESLIRIVNGLREKGVTVIYISHKLEEVLEISDRVSVMRDGKLISTKNVENVTREGIIVDMVGRTIGQEFPVREQPVLASENILEVKDLRRDGVFEDISFTLQKGQVLGLAGLVGAGRTEIVRAIFGADKLDGGEIFLGGKKVNITRPEDSIKNRIALLTEDRKSQGLLLQFPISKNISLANLGKVTHRGMVSRKQEKDVAEEYVELLSIKTPSTEQRAINLSGGNQQKVVIAKWLFADSDIIILDEPTRGIDIGAKHEIYLLINRLVQEGKSIIFISSELPELLAMSDRIIVVNEGRIKGSLERKEDITAENVMQLILKN